jgi:5-methylcytosine-specific restriction endonuclease McrA
MNKHGSKWIRPAKRRRIYERDGWQCCYCGVNMEHEVASKRTLDHIIPRAHGGSNHENNLVTACITCNSSRKDAPLVEQMLEKALEWAMRELPEVA